MQPEYTRQSTRKLVATIVTIIVVAGIVVFADHLKSSASTGNSVASTSSQTTPSSGTAGSSSSTSGSTGSSSSSSASSGSSTSGYKDGTYTASSSYYVPHGNESIQVSVTISNGVITSSSVTNSEGDPTSAYFQQDFASSYKSYVVGQKIADLQLGVIAGASDTTQGFNDALSQIQSQAQA